MPLPVTVAVVAPAVPERVTSPVAKSETESLKTTVKSIEDELVGSLWPLAWSMVTVKGVYSNAPISKSSPFGRVVPAKSVVKRALKSAPESIAGEED